MFTRTRVASGVADPAARLVTNTLSVSPGRAGRLESMFTFPGPSMFWTFGGTVSIGTTIDAVSTPLLNFKTAGPAGRPSGIMNTTCPGLTDRIVARRSLTAMLAFERFGPEGAAGARG